MEGTYGLLTIGYPAVIGYLAWDWMTEIQLCGSVLALLAGFFILGSRPFGFLLAFGIVLLKAGLATYSLLLVRFMSMDRLGLAIAILIPVVFLLILWFLYSCWRQPSSPRAPLTWSWKLGTTVAFLGMVLAYAIPLKDEPDVYAIAIRPKEVARALAPLAAEIGSPFREMNISGSESDNAIWRRQSRSSVQMSSHPKGMRISGFARHPKLILDFDACSGLLQVAGHDFHPIAFESDRFLWRDLPVKGIRFVRQLGPVTGTVILAQDKKGVWYVLLEHLFIFGYELKGTVYIHDPYPSPVLPRLSSWPIC